MRFGRFRETFSIERAGPGSRDENGRWQGGTAEVGTIDGATEPIDRRQVPSRGGKRVVADRTFWVERDVFPIRTAEDGGERSADVLIWGGHRWTVVALEDWGSHLELTGARRDDPPRENVPAETLAFENAVMRWLRAGLSGVEIIPGDDAGPMPTGLFGSLYLLRQGEEGQGAVRGDRVLIQMRAVCQVTFMRLGAMAAARTLMAWWSSPDSTVASERENLSVLDVGDAIQLSELAGSDLEEGAAVEIDVGYVHTLTQTHEAITEARVLVNPTVDQGTFVDAEADVDVRSDA